MTSKMNVVFFRRMEKDTVEDYQFLYHLEQNYIRGLPVRILAAMAELKSSLSVIGSAVLNIPCRHPLAQSVMVPILS